VETGHGQVGHDIECVAEQALRGGVQVVDENELQAGGGQTQSKQTNATKQAAK